jgi:hypothetical protein
MTPILIITIPSSVEKYACRYVFVPTYFIEKQQNFWWDELETVILHTKDAPARLVF